jgi:hypothetical protein
MTSIDDVIQPGQPIPADVTEISDCDDDTWTLRGERWTCEAMLESSLAPRFKGWSPDQLVTKHGPLTVTAVREQPAEPEPQQADASLLLDLVRQYGEVRYETGTLLDGGDRDAFMASRGLADALMRALGQRLTVTAVREPEPAEPDDVHYYFTELSTGLTYCGLDALEEDGVLTTSETGKATCAGCLVAAGEDPPGEPQQPDTGGLLDLVRQLRAAAEGFGYSQAAGQRTDIDAKKADALFARLAALIPQQPVQARDEDGNGWWIHDCGEVGEFTNAPGDDACDRCNLEGPWRPLLVGGDPAPEQPSAPDFLAAVNKLEMHLADVRRERDEARADRDQHLVIANHNYAQANAAWAEVERLNRVLRAVADPASASGTQPAEPGPLRLTLPEVPDGATLIGNASGNRYTCHLASEGWCSPERGPISLGRLLTVEGGVTVELAPPRELRTWPRIDSAPDSVKSFTGESGQRYVRHLAPNGTPTNLFQPDPAVTLLGERIPAATLSHWAEVDGPLTEVLDGHGATS